MTLRPWMALVGAWLVFVAMGEGVKRAVAPVAVDHPWVNQAAVKLALVMVVAIAAAASGLSWREMGWRKGTQKAGAGMWWGLALGAAASLVALLTGQTGMAALIGRFTFPQIVLWVWIVSSVAEELFCRGWFQAELGRLAGRGSPAFRTAQVVLPSAVLFGSLHLTLLWSGAGLGTTLLIVTSTTLLGWLCARLRERTGSVFPAIAAHVLFNVGGVVGGVIYTVGYRLATGQLPAPPG